MKIVPSAWFGRMLMAWFVAAAGARANDAGIKPWRDPLFQRIARALDEFLRRSERSACT